MNLLYLDIDSLRPDHLGCYGYHRRTSPHLDSLAARGLRLRSCHASDAPCLPSRTALMSGRFGWHTGVVNHGGVASQPRPEGAARGFSDTFARTSWPATMRAAGYKTATISPFGERHSAWHWFAGFNEVLNPVGRGGMEIATEVVPAVDAWLQRHAGADPDQTFFLHVNLWDPHTPYRTPSKYGNSFADDPTPRWLTEAVRAAHWQGCGPHSAQEINGFSIQPWFDPADFPRQPLQAHSLDDVRAMFDGYDLGVRFADSAVGHLLRTLDACGLRDHTAILVSADHGENLGELNIYGDHQTADACTTRVPAILHWPGVTDAYAGRELTGLHYAGDVAATLVELAGGTVPANWDGRSFAAELRRGLTPTGRDSLVVSQGAWTCQRGVLWEDFLYLRTTHDGYHGWSDEMLFDLAADPHEQHDLAPRRPDLVQAGRARLAAWLAERTATGDPDPFEIVLAEGGPFHCRGELPAYLERLRATGRSHWADRLAHQHPTAATSP